MFEFEAGFEPTAEALIGRSGNDSYGQQYPALLSLASKCEDPEDLVALSLAAYGWMPTILKGTLHYEDFNLSAVRGVNQENARAYLKQSKPLIGNSWIGTSKFLHFINPEVFPIWDSRVALAFGLKSYQGANTRRNYVRYFEFCHSSVEQYSSMISRIRSWLREEYGYCATDIRCLEMAIFNTSKDHTQNNL